MPRGTSWARHEPNSVMPHKGGMMSTHDDAPETSLQRTLAKAKRDELGFETGPQPNLSLAQVVAILSFAAHGDPQRAAQEAGVDGPTLAAWLGEDGFRGVFDQMLANKREGTKQIGAQLLPLMLLELSKIMLSGAPKEKLTAIKLHAQMQGLLITQAATVDKGTLEAIREELMKPRPIYRTLPNGTP
jgi:hypothetical protein